MDKNTKKKWIAGLTAGYLLWAGGVTTFALWASGVFDKKAAVDVKTTYQANEKGQAVYANESTINEDNLKDYVSNFPEGAKVDPGSLVFDEGEGKIKATIDGKPVEFTGFKPKNKDLVEDIKKLIDDTLNPTANEEGKKVLPSSLKGANKGELEAKIDNLLPSPTEKNITITPSLESFDDEKGTLTIKYEIKAGSQTTTTTKVVSGFKTTAQIFEEAVEANENNVVINDQGKQTLVSTVNKNNVKTNVNGLENKDGVYTIEVKEVSQTNTDSSNTSITIKVRYTSVADPNNTIDKEYPVDGFKSQDKQDVEDAKAIIEDTLFNPIANAEGEKVLPSTLNGANKDELETKINDLMPTGTTTGVTITPSVKLSNDENGTLTIEYTITKGNETLKAEKVVSGFKPQAKQEFDNEVEQITLIANDEAKNQYVSEITEDNIKDYVTRADSEPQYDYDVISIVKPTDADSGDIELTVKFKDNKYESEEKRFTISGFKSQNQKDVDEYVDSINGEYEANQNNLILASNLSTNLNSDKTKLPDYIQSFELPDNTTGIDIKSFNVIESNDNEASAKIELTYSKGAAEQTKTITISKFRKIKNVEINTSKIFDNFSIEATNQATANGEKILVDFTTTQNTPSQGFNDFFNKMKELIIDEIVKQDKLINVDGAKDKTYWNNRISFKFKVGTSDTTYEEIEALYEGIKAQFNKLDSKLGWLYNSSTNDGAKIFIIIEDNDSSSDNGLIANPENGNSTGLDNSTINTSSFISKFNLTEYANALKNNKTLSNNNKLTLPEYNGNQAGNGLSLKQLEKTIFNKFGYTVEYSWNNGANKENSFDSLEANYVFDEANPNIRVKITKPADDKPILIDDLDFVLSVQTLLDLAKLNDFIIGKLRTLNQTGGVTTESLENQLKDEINNNFENKYYKIPKVTNVDFTFTTGANGKKTVNATITFDKNLEVNTNCIGSLVDFNWSRTNVISTKIPIETSIYNSVNEEGKLSVSIDQLRDLKTFVEQYVVPHVVHKTEHFYQNNDIEVAIGKDAMIEQANNNRLNWLPEISSINNWNTLDSNNDVAFSIQISNFTAQQNNFDDNSFNQEGFSIAEYNGTYRIITPKFHCPNVILNSNNQISPNKAQLQELKEFTQNWIVPYVIKFEHTIDGNYFEQISSIKIAIGAKKVTEQANNEKPKWLPTISGISNNVAIDSNGLDFKIRLKGFTEDNSFDQNAFIDGFSIGSYKGRYIATPKFVCPNAIINASGNLVPTSDMFIQLSKNIEKYIKPSYNKDKDKAIKDFNDNRPDWCPSIYNLSEHDGCISIIFDGFGDAMTKVDTTNSSGKYSMYSDNNTNFYLKSDVTV